MRKPLRRAQYLLQRSRLERELAEDMRGGDAVAVTGIFGLVAFTVTRRTGEIGL